MIRSAGDRQRDHLRRHADGRRAVRHRDERPPQLHGERGGQPAGRPAAHRRPLRRRPVTCTTPVYFQGIYPAFNCDPYVGGTSGSPWIAQTPLGPTATGLIGGLHQGGCFSFSSYSPPLGLHALATYLRALAGARPDTAPVAGPNGCS
jgi:hypothetical protein